MEEGAGCLQAFLGPSAALPLTAAHQVLWGSDNGILAVSQNSGATSVPPLPSDIRVTVMQLWSSDLLTQENFRRCKRDCRIFTIYSQEPLDL